MQSQSISTQRKEEETMNRKEMLDRLKAGEDPLELSIEKWQDIVDGTGKNYSERNCALCKINDSCESCLVQKSTAHCHCTRTPYYDYQDASNTQQRREAAKAELEFLKSLRKKEKKHE